MKNIRLLALAATCIALSTAHAQSVEPAANPKMYAEFGYASLGYKETDALGGTWKTSPSALTGVFGYQAHPNIAVEALLGFGAGKDGVKLNGVGLPANVKLDSMFGVFVRPSIAIGESVELFGRVGWVENKLKLSAFGDSVSLKNDSVAYGIGANFNLSKTSYLQFNWTSYYGKHDTKIEGFGLAYGLRF